MPALIVEPRSTATTPAPERGPLPSDQSASQPSTVSGRTNKPPHARRGNRLASAAKIIRSAGFSLGFLTVRRRTLSFVAKEKELDLTVARIQLKHEYADEETQAAVDAGMNHERRAW
jgi:hypothetical protein